MNPQPFIQFIAIGLVSGVAAGLFGIGGGILIVPALVLFAGFSQHMAIGTSLAILLPPVGLAAVLTYYRNGNVNIPAAVIIAISLFAGGGIGAYIAHGMKGPQLRLLFGVFVICMGAYLVYQAIRQL